jgi:hypothetical protein
MVAPIGNSLPKLDFTGIDDHRTQNLSRHVDGYRLSCIDEHEKENSRDCEDVSPAILSYTVKTPLLRPLRTLKFHRRTAKESRTSDDSIPISPFELEAEQATPYEKRGLNQEVFSTSLYTVSILSSHQARQDDVAKAQSNAPKLYSPNFFEVQWRNVR